MLGVELVGQHHQQSFASRSSPPPVFFSFFFSAIASTKLNVPWPCAKHGRLLRTRQGAPGALVNMSVLSADPRLGLGGKTIAGLSAAL